MTNIKDYYDVPTMVTFLDYNYEDVPIEEIPVLAGIAYKDEIICGCCGGIIEIKELKEWYARYGIKENFDELNWINIVEEIAGDC